MIAHARAGSSPSGVRPMLLLLAFAASPGVPWGLAQASAAVEDVHSHANTGAWRQRHLSLHLDVDFAGRRLSGTAELTLERVGEGARELVLDTRNLVVRRVWLVGEDGLQPLAFHLGPADELLGPPLIVELPSAIHGEPVVRISYQTRPEASGLQWLAPGQTAGGRHPFLFSQSQAIHARSWVPLQDTPSVRFTYDATVVTPPALRALMSADNDPAAPLDGRFEFEMRQSIPSYLLALAVGDLVFEPIGERTGVYAEPPVVEAAAAEFEDTERMLEIGERLFGPYRWGRYDLLILPPSFPFGGMENPRLSFITPTVLAGDKSLVALIAHELAHSWSGNLVTNATWRDLWLNEGFTVFLESRIMGAVYGERRVRMEALLGYQSLVADLEELEPRAELLAIDLGGRNPDAVFTEVPYEKGRLLLVWLEQAFGAERLDRFLKDYFEHFAFESITTEDFLAYLEERLLAPNPGVVSIEEVRAWIYEPGLPADAPRPAGDVFEPVARARERWLAGEIAAAEIDTGDWVTQDWLFFLNNMPDELTPAQLAELDAAFGLTGAGNNEIAHSWLLLAIGNDYRPAYDRLEDYLVSIGRNKLVRPLYQALMRTEAGAERARRIFERARPGYHPLTVAENEPIVYPEADPERQPDE